MSKKEQRVLVGMCGRTLFGPWLELNECKVFAEKLSEVFKANFVSFSLSFQKSEDIEE